MRLFPATLWITLLFGGVPVQQGQTSPATPLSTEESAFAAARAQTDPQPRIAALQNFVSQYPTSSHERVARQLLLDTCLRSSGDHVDTIQQVAASLVQSAAPGIERWTEQAQLADRLSEAGPAGVDMADATRWAGEAVTSMTEPTYRRAVLQLQARYRLPPLGPTQLHRQFARDRALALAALANVRLHQGEAARAAPLLEEAFQLDPLNSETNRLRGTLAVQQGREAEGLDDLIRANALGPLPASARETELTLFRKLQHGDEPALDARIDAAYARIYPPPFHLAKRQMAAGGHAALLELFTGSDCAPCAGPDLAVDSLLTTYSSHDLVVLEFDEHVPRPDPLATPEGAARAGSYGIASTPAAVLDGQPLEILGASRQDVQNIVLGFADALEAQASRPSGLQIALTAALDASGRVLAHLALSTKPVPDKEAADATGDTSLRALQRAEVHIALAQDSLRYQGLNGVRSHRMVVRAMQARSASAYLNTTSGPPILFDLPAIEEAHQAYLTDYEQHNDQYGPVTFASKAFPLQPEHLAVVVWVQDPLTKQVLQSASTDLLHP